MKYPIRPSDEEHAFVDTTNRFPLDALLRKRGYHIASRPPRGEPLWVKEGKTLTQTRALQSLRSKETQDAKYLEELTQSGME